MCGPGLGYTPAHLAARSENVEMLTVLLNLGANLQQPAHNVRNEEIAPCPNETYRVSQSKWYEYIIGNDLDAYRCRG